MGSELDRGGWHLVCRAESTSGAIYEDSERFVRELASVVGPLKLGGMSQHAHEGSMVCDDRPHPRQVQAWRAIGGAGRSQLGIELRRQVRRWKLAALRTQHPDWDEGRLQAELAKLLLRGSS